MKLRSTRKMNVDFKSKSTTKFLLIAILAIASLMSTRTFALNPADFTVSRVTAPFFPVDANRPNTFTRAYVGFEIKNISSTSYSDLNFSIDSIVSPTAGNNYSVIYPSNRLLFIGTLAPGASRVCYFYVSYPANPNRILSTLTTKLTDNTINSKISSFSYYNRSVITSPAGGVTKQASLTLTNGDIVDDVLYNVGNPQTNDEMDFQPSVSPLYDPSKLSLIKVEVITSQIGGVNVGSTDSLYFIGTGRNNISPYTIKIRFTFRPGGLNSKTYILPYAGATSGNTNYKYVTKDSAGILGAILGSDLFTISKSSNKSTYYVCDTAIFTIKLNNNSGLNYTVDSIIDRLPSRFQYIGITPTSQIQSANCSVMPSNLDTGVLKFKGEIVNNGNRSFYIPAHDSLILQYSAKVSCIAALDLLSEVTGYIGSEVFDRDTNVISVIANPLYQPLAVTDNYSVLMGSSITKDVTLNDYSSLDNPNVWSIVTNPSHGSISFNNGIFTYTPNANYHGVDSFKYKVCDANNDCSTASVYINVEDAPVAVNDVFAPDQDTPYNGNVSGNDYQSLDGGNTWSLTNGPSHGTITFNSNGSFTYTPALGFTDIDTFYYSLCDADNDCSTALVRLIVQAGGTTPITLTSFNARLANNETAVLTWNAQSEINANRYEIERSENAISFSNRGNVAAIGSPTRSQDYTYNDALNTSSAVVYYRLKMVDNDGSYKYSNIVALKLKDAGSTINTYPNPFVSNIKIDFVSQLEEVGHIKLITIDGRIVTQFDVKLTKGNNAIQINNLASLPKATYTVEVSTATKKLTKRVVKN